MHYNVFNGDLSMGKEAARAHGQALPKAGCVWANAVFGGSKTDLIGRNIFRLPHLWSYGSHLRRGWGGQRIVSLI